MMLMLLDVASSKLGRGLSLGKMLSTRVSLRVDALCSDGGVYL